jgi:proline iminopeptidase
MDVGNQSNAPCAATDIRTGYVEVEGGRIRYRRHGAGTPLLVVAGGPGAGSGYLRRLEGLGRAREVVFYDHVGSGRSDRPDDPALWTFDRFVDEIRRLREALSLDEVHVLGHSWGSWLLVEYLLSDAVEGVRSAVLANGAASAADFSSGVQEVCRQLSPTSSAAICRFADDPWSESREYLDALVELYTSHLVERPDQARKLLQIQRETPVYTHMMGPHEAALVGSLATWDRRGDLGRIHVPTLVIAGARDHNTPGTARVLSDGIPGSRFSLFENSAHNPFDDEEPRFLTEVASFLHEEE